jgi:hypothetical protein
VHPDLRVRALQRCALGCKTRISKPIFFSALPCVAPYSVPVGVRVVSGGGVWFAQQLLQIH